MQPFKTDFIDFMVDCGALRFGDFTTKSGRPTPYFIDTGAYRTGAQLARLARFYAAAIRDRGIEFDLLFGPAYKGIPLAVATAVVLADDHGQDVGVCFNRKEAKDHGEGGMLVGQVPKDGDRVLIIEDVTTAGTSVRETVPVLRAAADVQIAGLVVAVDRMERGTGPDNALVELRRTYDMDAFAIATIDEVIEHLHGRRIDGRVLLDDALRERLRAYRAEHGGTGAA